MLTKKEICMNEKSIAYYSGFSGIEIKKIEYGVEDYVYFVAGAWCSKESYHKAKIYYNENHDYFMYQGSKIRLDECIRM